jgi:uncharacterized protein YbgA (DUF1722 family)/uncharacterized protein YbbK (DUF523 family)
VRWDAGHKRDRFLTDLLGTFVEWVPVCPELEAGMGIPREPVHLRHAAGGIRLVGTRSAEDWTRRMEHFSAHRVRELEALDLCGYVLKKDSPSCGMERVKVRFDDGQARREGRGLFAEALMRRFPALPVEEEGRLNDAALRENWIERVFAHRRLRSLFAERWTLGQLVAFHAAHKLQLLAHSPEAYRKLGRLVAEGKTRGRAELRDAYAGCFMDGLAARSTRGRHVNVLQHCIGYLRDRVEPSVRESLARQIADFRAGFTPLVVPVTMLRHYVEQLGLDYLAQQTYLDPHPKELMLRNHV